MKFFLQNKRVAVPKIENNNMNLYLSLYLSNYVPKKYLNSQYFYIVRELDNSRVAAKILNENEKIIIRPLTPSVSHYKYTLVISFLSIHSYLLFQV